ncbi:acyl-CoA N-acyltransferase [Russula emetica]|nr:acyl-CoA N-acyltransferase [Russula emetica]
MENASVSIPALSTQWSTDELIVRPLTSADIPNVRALHAELAPSYPPLRPTFFHQLLTSQTHLSLIATLPSSDKPVACIAAALHVLTSDLTSRTAPAPPVEVHVLALGVLPAYRRRGLATRLLRTAASSLRVLAANAPQVPTTLRLKQHPTRLCADVARTDGNARAFWNHVGMHEQETASRREAWSIGSWRDVISVAGPVLSAA